MLQDMSGQDLTLKFKTLKKPQFHPQLSIKDSISWLIIIHNTKKKQNKKKLIPTGVVMKHGEMHN